MPDALVHGDCWQGNSLWVGDELRWFIDCDAAGTGPPGIDVGTMRLDAAVFFGADAMDDVVTGWGGDVWSASRRPRLLGPRRRAHLADRSRRVVANLQRLGRPDLDAATMAARREESVRRAPRRDLSELSAAFRPDPGLPPLTERAERVRPSGRARSLRPPDERARRAHLVASGTAGAVASR